MTKREALDQKMVKCFFYGVREGLFFCLVGIILRQAKQNRGVPNGNNIDWLRGRTSFMMDFIS